MAYADTTELFRILKIRNPSDDQNAAGDRVMETAAAEIDSEIDLDADTTLTPGQLELAAQVNLQRAAELWEMQEVALGFIGIGSDGGAARLANNTWEKHANTLAPLKSQWGLA